MQVLIDVRSILDHVGGSIDLSGDYELDRLVVGHETFVARGPVRVEATLSNAGESLVAYGTASFPATATCSRCLCEFPIDIAGDLDGIWERPGQPLPDEEAAEPVDSEGRVDIGPSIIAALTIEAPFAPLHDEECLGLCASCGADLNVEECSCGSEPDADHPFAALRDLGLKETDSD